MKLQKLDPNQSDASVMCTAYTVTLLDDNNNPIGKTGVLSNSSENGVGYLNGYGVFQQGYEHWWLPRSFIGVLSNAQSIRFDATPCTSTEEAWETLERLGVSSLMGGAGASYDIAANISTTWRCDVGAPWWENIFYSDDAPQNTRMYGIHIVESAVTWFTYTSNMPDGYIVGRDGMTFTERDRLPLWQGAAWCRSATC